MGNHDIHQARSSQDAQRIAWPCTDSAGESGSRTHRCQLVATQTRRNTERPTAERPEMGQVLGKAVGAGEQDLRRGGQVTRIGTNDAAGHR